MVSRWLGEKCFVAIHRHNLVYNTCWEDPRLDRVALDLSEEDTVVVITSAGCNALDYALQSPKQVHAVDVNPLQNALLELKIAAAETLSFEDFFQVFGRGNHPQWEQVYHDAVRPRLNLLARTVWDRRLDFFDGSSRRKSFYFRGTSGMFAWAINAYLDRPVRLRDAVSEILEANSVAEQQEIFRRRGISEILWRRPLKWMLRRDVVMAMLGVPANQRAQIDRVYPGGIGGFIQDRIESVFNEIPLKDNYFWRVYLTGQYTEQCCPEYLARDNFEALKSVTDRVRCHTDTVAGFLDGYKGEVNRFVLLDHMDWLCERRPEDLAREWQSIVNRAGPESRVLWRSAAMKVDFVDPVQVVTGGRVRAVGELLNYHQQLAERLHAKDRVNTYGSFYVADLEGTAA